MKNPVIFFSALVLFIGSISANETRAAAAAVCTPSSSPTVTVCINQPCAQVGQTTMDGDQKNIIACLLNDAGTAYVWKSMSSSSSSFPINHGIIQVGDSHHFTDGATGGNWSDGQVICQAYTDSEGQPYLRSYVSVKINSRWFLFQNWSEWTKSEIFVNHERSGVLTSALSYESQTDNFPYNLPQSICMVSSRGLALVFKDIPKTTAW